MEFLDWPTGGASAPVPSYIINTGIFIPGGFVKYGPPSPGVVTMPPLSSPQTR